MSVVMRRTPLGACSLLQRNKIRRQGGALPGAEGVGGGTAGGALRFASMLPGVSEPVERSSPLVLGLHVGVQVAGGGGAFLAVRVQRKAGAADGVLSVPLRYIEAVFAPHRPEASIQ
eukprot:Hpha_TRINITY_DN14982_c4_g20::TRINITY_DN14982_c4_g20_i2::g.143410::m.143410